MMNKIGTLTAGLILSAAALWGQPANRQPFGEGWRFRQVQDLSAREAAKDFNDYGWRTLDLPHDWGVETASEAAPGETRKLTWWGKAWYRKHLTVTKEDLKGRIWIEVDGAMSDAEVWVNGIRADRCVRGDVSFAVDMTPYLQEGDNAVAISLDNKRGSFPGYPGGGLYRPVWLTRVPRAGVAHWGTRMEVLDLRLPEGNDGASARLRLHLRFRNADADVAARVVTRIYPEGEGVLTDAVASAETSLAALTDSTVLAQDFLLDDAQLWSPGRPARYRAVTCVSTPYGIDVYTTRFGIRDVRPDGGGLLLNGTAMPLRGVRLTEDLGALGTAWVENLWEDRLQRLKALGCNAVTLDDRLPAPQLLDLCDRLGLLFAGGTDGPMAERDCNHPCLVGRDGLPAFDLTGYASTGATTLDQTVFTAAGFPTESHALYRGLWQAEQAVAEFTILQPSRDGQTQPVLVHTNGDSGVLYINGRSQGYRKVQPGTGLLRWEQATHESGDIEVVVFRAGRPWIRKKADAVGAPAAVVWAEDIERTIAALPGDKPVILRIPVEVVDAAGRPVPDADPDLEFHLAGHGRILAVDSGDPASRTPYSSLRIKAFRGKAAVYIYKKGDEKILLSVRSSGLKCPRMEL